MKERNEEGVEGEGGMWAPFNIVLPLSFTRPFATLGRSWWKGKKMKGARAEAEKGEGEGRSEECKWRMIKGPKPPSTEPGGILYIKSFSGSTKSLMAAILLPSLS